MTQPRVAGTADAGATLARPHVWAPGDEGWTGPALLLLHGTGGNESDLLPLGRELAPGAPLLAPRGTVLEGTMPRFFRRLREGVFDEADLTARAAELAWFIAAAAGEYGFTPGSLVAVGFSNGANIASALLLTHPEAISDAILIAAMPPFGAAPAADLAGHRVLISNGRRDPMAPPSLTTRLVDDLSSRGATVDLLLHPGGHQLAADHLPAMRAFLEQAGSTAPAAPTGPAGPIVPAGG
jgi:phospholipase/carboxylesterase